MAQSSEEIRVPTTLSFSYCAEQMTRAKTKMVNTASEDAGRSGYASSSINVLVRLEKMPWRSAFVARARKSAIGEPTVVSLQSIFACLSANGSVIAPQLPPASKPSARITRTSFKAVGMRALTTSA